MIQGIPILLQDSAENALNTFVYYEQERFSHYFIIFTFKHWFCDVVLCSWDIMILGCPYQLRDDLVLVRRPPVRVVCVISATHACFMNRVSSMWWSSIDWALFYMVFHSTFLHIKAVIGHSAPATVGAPASVEWEGMK
jgi:hypothetical protein